MGEPLGSADYVVRLGQVSADGIAVSICALVDRGVARRPWAVGPIAGEVELRFVEDLAPVRMAFVPGEVLVEDGEAAEPDLIVVGRLPDIVALTSAPLVGGWPNPARRRGRAALARVADGRVRIHGNRLLARRLLALFEL